MTASVTQGHLGLSHWQSAICSQEMKASGGQLKAPLMDVFGGLIANNGAL